MERIICFGITESKGRYHMKGDSIFFHSVASGRNNGNFYKYAVLKRPAVKSKSNLGIWECYEHLTDTLGLPMAIVENRFLH